MKRFFRDADGACLAPQGSVVCIGAFDGVHRGHAALLAHARRRAQARRLPLVVVSFEPLPRQHFQGRDAVPRLTSPRQRLALLLRRCEAVGLLRFGRDMVQTRAEDFARRVLVGRLAAREVWVGPGFRFGYERRGDLAMLQSIGAASGFVAGAIEAHAADGERISSSRIRHALAGGDFESAAALLGRRFAMEGHVVRGQQLGRRLGYPTANLKIRWGRAPVRGIFAVRVHGAGLAHWPSVASLGTRPTVAGVEPLLEAHLFDFDGDLYGRLLSVEFVAKLRDEIKFDGLEPLVQQMHRDAAQARDILASGPNLEQALTS
ncbi:MAG: bifunctional riboflavin kinase/FAD synthetase [Pseudomonadota bacterium]